MTGSTQWSVTVATFSLHKPGLRAPSGAQPSPPLGPHVGIFWDLAAPGRAPDLLADRSALADAEPYGARLGHARGHCEIWDKWQALGARALARRGLPAALAWQEYDAYPRGRVIFTPATHSFIVYADPKCHTRRHKCAVLSLFGLSSRSTTFAYDAHYRCGRSGEHI